MEINQSTQRYVGRFAPSPSGKLHFGSLVCALASYLDAKANRGEWLVRIEDLDPPREQPGAAHSILKSLEDHGLLWDREVTYQSLRSEEYQAALQTLESNQLIYRCNCTRKRLSQLRSTGKVAYDRHCTLTPPPANTAAAWRLDLNKTAGLLKNKSLDFRFDDGVFGAQEIEVEALGDFVIHRKDGLFAYNLAVVVDDIAQNVSHVVRGADLLGSVGQQKVIAKALSQARGAIAPYWHYTHIPLVIAKDGNKLSKQNRAKTIDANPAENNLQSALEALAIPLPERLSISEMLRWGIQQWRPQQLQRVRHIEAPPDFQ